MTFVFFFLERFFSLYKYSQHYASVLVGFGSVTEACSKLHPLTEVAYSNHSNKHFGKHHGVLHLNGVNGLQTCLQILAKFYHQKST